MRFQSKEASWQFHHLRFDPSGSQPLVNSLSQKDIKWLFRRHLKIRRTRGGPGNKITVFERTNQMVNDVTRASGSEEVSLVWDLIHDWRQISITKESQKSHRVLVKCLRGIFDSAREVHFNMPDSQLSWGSLSETVFVSWGQIFKPPITERIILVPFMPGAHRWAYIPTLYRRELDRRER